VIRRLWPLAALALIAAGCSNSSGDAGTAKSEKAFRFAACMRENGIRTFPDPDASGALTIDAVANGSSLNTDSAAFRRARSACRDLEPSGFTGHARSDEQQARALEFARCMRDNGVKDFPDPVKDAPLIDTSRIPSAAGRGARSIPGFTDAVHKCTAARAGQLGLEDR
jgi:hypothetical protein